MAQQHSIAGIAVQRAPGFIGNGHFTERCTNIELHLAIGWQGIELTVTRMLRGIPCASCWVVARSGVVVVSWPHGSPFCIGVHA